MLLQIDSSISGKVGETMWRAGSAFRGQQHRFIRAFSTLLPHRSLIQTGGLASCPKQTNISGLVSTTTVRQFSRRRGGLGSDEDDDIDIDPNQKGGTDFSAADMEFFDNKRFDEYLGDDDDEENENVDDEYLKEEAYRRRQEEIKQELDKRTGRIWTDPWQITEEEWMSSISPDDLPDWSPDFVSRISQERVKLHPGT